MRLRWRIERRGRKWKKEFSDIRLTYTCNLCSDSIEQELPPDRLSLKAVATIIGIKVGCFCFGDDSMQARYEWQAIFVYHNDMLAGPFVVF